jgi:hypothetical protein
MENLNIAILAKSRIIVSISRKDKFKLIFISCILM